MERTRKLEQKIVWTYFHSNSFLCCNETKGISQYDIQSNETPLLQVFPKSALAEIYWKRYWCQQ
jgi:hypothetical protein